MAKLVLLLDLDGTLSDDRPRKHLFEAGAWDKYHDGLMGDAPHEPILALVLALVDKAMIIISTARPELYRMEALDWLAKYKIHPDELLMRGNTDYRSGHAVKIDAATQFFSGSLPENLLVIDDRSSVVEAWRMKGVMAPSSLASEGHHGPYKLASPDMKKDDIKAAGLDPCAVGILTRS